MTSYNFKLFTEAHKKYSVHACGSQQFPQLFVGDVYGISELIEKIGVEVDTILKVTGKAFDPSLYCLPRITIL